MKLIVTAPTYWPTPKDVLEKCWLYFTSCSKAGIAHEIHYPYGTGSTQYPGQFSMRVTGHVEFLKLYRSNGGDASHVLFSDAWDVLMVRSLEEIVMRYKWMGAPEFLIGGGSVESKLYNIQDPTPYLPYYDASVLYRYPSTTFYLAEIDRVIDWMGRLDKSSTHDEGRAFVDAWCDGWFRPTIDTKCEIFQELPENCEVREGWLYNKKTDSWPCVVHFGGGYVDPEHGKDDAILPWAVALGIV